jgi:hypothetical protein
MYAAPVGFDPYAFLNSDGSGGVSKTAGQLVGAAMDLSGGMGLGGNQFAAGFDLSAAPWGTRGTLSTVTPTGFTNTSGAGAGREVTVDANFVYDWSVTYTKSDSITPFGVLIDVALVESTASSGTISGTSPGAFGSFYLRLGGNASVTITGISLRRSSSGLTNAATQATTANKPTIAAGPSSLFNGFSFDGVNDQLATAVLAASATETHVVSAVLPSVVAANGFGRRRTTGLAGETSFRVAAGGALEMQSFVAGPTGVTASGGAISANVPFTAAGCKAAASNYARLNGTQTATIAATNVATAASTALTIGNDAANFMAGTMYFYAWLPAEPTAADLAILERAAGICSGQVTS